MSIAKSTRRRKKVAPADAGFASPPQTQAGSRFQTQYVEKYPEMGVVHEGEIRHFLFTVPLADLSTYGARFRELMEVLDAARQLPTAERTGAVIRLIAGLEKESRNRRYRQVLKAIAAASASEAGLNEAYYTALRIVEMAFEWTNEYLFAFGLYERRLKASRHVRQRGNWEEKLAVYG